MNNKNNNIKYKIVNVSKPIDRLLLFCTQVVAYTKWSFCTQTAVYFVHKINNKLIHWITT